MTCPAEHTKGHIAHSKVRGLGGNDFSNTTRFHDAAYGHGGGVALGIVHASAHVGIKRESMEAHKHFAFCRYWQWFFDQSEVAVLRRADGAGGKGHLLHRVAHLVSVLCSVPR